MIKKYLPFAVAAFPLLFGEEFAYSHKHDPSYVDAVNALQRPFIETARKARRTVVQLRVELAGRSQFPVFPNRDDDLFRHFFGLPREDYLPQVPGGSLGTGFFVSSDGYILTNYHVVRNAKKIRVYFVNNEEEPMEATFVGGDSSTDVALLKVDVENHDYLSFCGDSEVEVGQMVIAVGNPFELTTSVTTGIVSAKNRSGLQVTDIGNFIQTDAPVNMGNSGGPLMNLYGEVVGVNTAILSPSGGGFVGVGFAIPSSICLNVMEQLKAHGHVRRGSLGVEIQSLDESARRAFQASNGGALVTNVVKDSPAEKGGLLPGDVIVKVDQVFITSPKDLSSRIQMRAPGDTVILQFLRNGALQEISVKLEDKQKGEENTYRDSHYKATFETANPANLQRYNHNSTDSVGVLIVDAPEDSIFRHVIGSLILQVNGRKVSTVEELKAACSGNGDSFLVRSPNGKHQFICSEGKKN